MHMGKVLHKQIYRPGAFGGTVNTTICGRMQGKDFNIAETDAQVTCKFCVQKMQKHSNDSNNDINGNPNDPAQHAS